MTTVVPAVRDPRSQGRIKRSIIDSGIVYALAVLVAILVIVSTIKGQPAYLRSDNVANILAQTAPFAILAVLQTVVLITGNFDISIASTVALTSYVVIEMSATTGLAAAILLALIIGGSVGAINGTLVEIVGVNSFIITLGMLTAVRGLVLVLTGGDATSADPGVGEKLASLYYTTHVTPNLFLVAGIVLLLPASVHVVTSKGSALSLIGAVRLGSAALGAGLVLLAFFRSYQLELVQPVYLAAAISLAFWAILRLTVVGRRFYAVGGSAEAARLSGVRVTRYKIGAFVMMGLAAGLVGAIFAAQLTSITPTGFQGAEFTVLTAAILGGTSLYGGTGDVLKSVAGALFLFTLVNGFSAINLGSIWQQLVEGIVIIVAVSLYTVASRRSSGGTT